MGRWSQYDEDSYRLPEGVVRTGYDADTQTYYYSDGTTTYEGSPGNRYGVLRPAHSTTTTRDVDATPYRIEYDDPNTPASAYDEYESPGGCQVCLQFLATPFQSLYRIMSESLWSPTELKRDSETRPRSSSQQPLLSSRSPSRERSNRSSTRDVRRQSTRDHLLNGAHPKKKLYCHNPKGK